MKTQIHISNLKKMAITAITALVLTTGSYTQPSPEESRNEEMISRNRLAVMMDRAEESIRYNAPTAEETEEYTAALNRLEELAVVTESSVKYEAPEAIEVVNELESLNEWAVELEASLQYKAPAADEIAVVDVEMAWLDKLAAETEATLVFRAPMNVDEVDGTIFANNGYLLADNK